MVELLANTMVAIILQYINVSNKHTVCLKFTQCYMSITSQKAVAKNYRKFTVLPYVLNVKVFMKFKILGENIDY